MFAADGKMSSGNTHARVWLVLQTAVGIVALSLWFGYIAMFEHFDATRPTKPDAAAGRVIPQNNHGHIVYLTDLEQRKLMDLQYCSIVLFLPATLILYIYRRESEKIARFSRIDKAKWEPPTVPD
jgi:hypothetical protein